MSRSVDYRRQVAEFSDSLGGESGRQWFSLATQAVSHSHSALGAFYRRLQSRLGAPKAITATAHKIARLFYKLWSTGGIYADPGEDYYKQKYRERLVKHLKKTAQSLGFEVVPHSPRVESVS
ncbi:MULTISPECIES: hypothetical protein [Trichocoleus]|uniref:Transposase n=1 Tax=Trichocoleus desertorum GB2-A4 TaxID=2933944 RepID=A0ABV0JDY1_9CYAN|nr:hypothetical protein [Trichocoleus sp. FACHB-46]MBD1865175.1 hypothetical protein [Trichocoleus sp. FACHB-46]